VISTLFLLTIHKSPARHSPIFSAMCMQGFVTDCQTVQLETCWIPLLNGLLITLRLFGVQVLKEKVGSTGGVHLVGHSFG
jgi:hypothetical protein